MFYWRSLECEQNRQVCVWGLLEIGGNFNQPLGVTAACRRLMKLLNCCVLSWFLTAQTIHLKIMFVFKSPFLCLSSGKSGVQNNSILIASSPCVNGVKALELIEVTTKLLCSVSERFFLCLCRGTKKSCWTELWVLVFFYNLDLLFLLLHKNYVILNLFLHGASSAFTSKKMLRSMLIWSILLIKKGFLDHQLNLVSIRLKTELLGAQSYVY